MQGNFAQTGRTFGRVGNKVTVDLETFNLPSTVDCVTSMECAKGDQLKGLEIAKKKDLASVFILDKNF